MACTKVILDADLPVVVRYVYWSHAAMSRCVFAKCVETRAMIDTGTYYAVLQQWVGKQRNRRCCRDVHFTRL